MTKKKFLLKGLLSAVGIASTVGIVKNLMTGRQSPQFHLVFDDFFETVHSHSMTPPPLWEKVLHFNTFANDFDDPSCNLSLIHI